MKNSRKLITTAIALILSVSTLGSQLFAQQKNGLTLGKIGKVHIGSSVMVGHTLLKPGMYQVQLWIYEGSGAQTLKKPPCQFEN